MGVDQGTALWWLSQHHNATAGRAVIAHLPMPSGFSQKVYEAWEQADYENHSALCRAYPMAGRIWTAWRKGGLEEAWQVYTHGGVRWDRSHETELNHGTRWCAQHHHCNCAECAEAERLYFRNYRAERRSRGKPLPSGKKSKQLKRMAEARAETIERLRVQDGQRDQTAQRPGDLKRKDALPAELGHAEPDRRLPRVQAGSEPRDGSRVHVRSDEAQAAGVSR